VEVVWFVLGWGHFSLVEVDIGLVGEDDLGSGRRQEKLGNISEGLGKWN
jgi:hypothetical protein